MAFLDNAGLERLWAHILLKLNRKVDKIEGKGLSTEDYTTAEKEKLVSMQGVHVGTEKPTDPNVSVWVNPDGDADAVDYILPPATPDTLGGMMVGEGLNVDEDGRVNVDPESEYELVREIVIEGNETPEIMVDQFADGTSLVAKQLLIRITQPPTSDRSGEHTIHTTTYNEKSSVAVCTIFLLYHETVNSYGVNEICARNGRLFGTTARTYSFTNLPNMSNNTPTSLIGETSAEYFKRVKVASYKNVFLPGTTIKIEAVRYNA